MLIGAFICGCKGPGLSAAEVDFIRRFRPWGLILFKRNVETRGQLQALTSHFRESVGRADAPVLIDQEGGRVQRMGPPEWLRYPAGRRYGEMYRENALEGLTAARLINRLMADDLHEVGINVDCVPVLDVPQPDGHDVIGDRAYDTDGQVIALLARAAAAGLMEGGVLPVIKHIPGHGRARVDSHLELPVVRAAQEELRTVDFPPFAALADLPMAMTAHVVYTAFGSDAPATLSDTLMQVVRRDMQFAGLVMTDDLSMKALTGSMGEKVAQAQAAGVDMMLHCNGDMVEMTAVAEAAGALDGKALQRADAALAMLRPPVEYDRDHALYLHSKLVGQAMV
jgi:beta-N-acetylhexosaminidase